MTTQRDTSSALTCGCHVGADGAVVLCDDHEAEMLGGPQVVHEYDADHNLVRRWEVEYVTGGERGTVHKVDCRHANHSLPWRPGSYYARKRACMVCLPSGLPREESTRG